MYKKQGNVYTLKKVGSHDGQCRCLSFPNLKKTLGQFAQIRFFAFRKPLSIKERSSSRSSTNCNRSAWLRTDESDRNSALMAACLLSPSCSLKRPIVLYVFTNRGTLNIYSCIFLVIFLVGKFFGKISPNFPHRLQRSSISSVS